MFVMEFIQGSPIFQTILLELYLFNLHKVRLNWEHGDGYLPKGTWSFLSWLYLERVVPAPMLIMVDII